MKSAVNQREKILELGRKWLIKWLQKIERE